MADYSFHKAQYARQGFSLLTNAAREDFIARLGQVVRKAQASDMVEGDKSDHSWKEINLKPMVPLEDVMIGPGVAAIVGQEPVSMAQWLNIYMPGEFISTHVDAGGEAQLMIPVELPESGEGGLLWIGTKERTIPMAVGDVLIFAAHRLRHGTTPLLTGRRISFNARLWFSGGPTM